MKKTRQAKYFKDRKTGKEPAKSWLDSLKDKQVRAKIDVRILRAEFGNFGDHKNLGDGVSELRIDIGPGYRVYYGLEGKALIILLVVGDKKTQKKDIDLAKRLWLIHKEEVSKNG